MFKKLFGEIMRKSLVLSLSMLFAAQVSAQSELAMLLGVLKDNGTITVDQYKRLMAEHQGEKVETQKLSKIKQPIANEAQVVVKNGIKVKSADKQFSAHIGGRVEAHAAWYKSDDFDLGDGTAIRRARLFIKGTLYNDWQYKLDYDFVAGGTKGIKDAFLAYKVNDSVQLITGNYKVPFSLEFQASSHANTFIERSLAFGLSPGRHLGAGINMFKDNWSLQAGIFGNKIHQSNAGQDEETLIAGRLVWLPVKNDDYFVHLGVAGLHSNNGDNISLRLKSNPESYVASTQLVDTGAISDVDDYSQIGFEAAVNYQRLNVQSEYIKSSVNTGLESLDFNSWYIQSSLFLTNDRRVYKKGKFGIVKPQSILGQDGTGAWELAMRYSEIDLNAVDVIGGIERNMTLALNVYATPEIRFTAEYLKVLEVSKNNPTTDNASLDLGQVRMEWVF
ncbi:porin [Colwellia sp. Arc7-D]|nr:porin [Colwellia sp. Arc7-D]